MTMVLRCSIEMPNISYAWKELKEQLGEDFDSKVKGMVFLKGKQVRKAGPLLLPCCWFRDFMRSVNTVQWLLPALQECCVF